MLPTLQAPGSRVLLALVLALASCAEHEDATPEARHAATPAVAPPGLVILISLDTVRADRLEAYGYGRPNTPHLASLAADGVRFDTVAAQASHTLPSHKSLFHGKYPLRLLRETTGESLEQLAEHERPQRHLVGAFQQLTDGSLIESFRGAGYRTVAITDDVWVSREMGFHAGFDAFDAAGGHFEEILPKALRWLERGVPERAFLFLHAYDAHCPYVSRAPYDDLFCADHSTHLALDGKCAKPDLLSADLTPRDLAAIGDHYDAGIASADAYLGQLSAALREHGLYDESLIAVTSDHGESLGEDGRIGHGGLYLEQLLVPLVIKFPASWKLAGRVVSEPVEVVDVLPTLAEACGVALPADLDGSSRLDLARGTGKGRDALLAQLGMREGRDGVTSLTKRALLEPGRRLVIEDLASGAIEAFDLSGTAPAPMELGDEAGEVLRRLARGDRADIRGERDAPADAEITDDFRRRLEALGYVAGEDESPGADAE